MTRYVINKSFQTSVTRSERVLALAEAFGLGLEEREFHVFRNLEIDIELGQVIYITGQSGSGKSLLLRELARQMSEKGLRVSDIDQVTFEERPLIDQLGTDMQSALDLLSRAGINDGYLTVRKPSELSDGQRYRLRLAKLFETPSDVVVADEFGAVLDRVTAKTIAFNAQKLMRSRNTTLIVATTHSDLIQELGPDLIIEKRFEQKVKIIHATP